MAWAKQTTSPLFMAWPGSATVDLLGVRVARVTSIAVARESDKSIVFQ